MKRTFSRMRVAVVLSALVVGVILPSWAQDTKDTCVGVVQNPCCNQPQLPEAFAKYLAAKIEAKRLGKPAPVMVMTPEMQADSQRFRNELMQSDFAGLCRYEAANLRVSNSGPIRLVFLGDSITEGWGTENPNFFNSELVNRGIGGQGTTQMLVRFGPDVIDLKPRAVHILAGTNDIAGNAGPTTIKRIERSIVSMVEQSQSHGIKVVLGSVLPTSGFPWRPEIKPVDSIQELNAWLKSYAQDHGLIYVDYYSAMEDSAHGMKRELTDDGIHPNAKGYAVMEELLLKALRSM